jgi:hypothetical protein
MCAGAGVRTFGVVLIWQGAEREFGMTVLRRLARLCPLVDMQVL